MVLLLLFAICGDYGNDCERDCDCDDNELMLILLLLLLRQQQLIRSDCDCKIKCDSKKTHTQAGERAQLHSRLCAYCKRIALATATLLGPIPIVCVSAIP